MDAIKKLGLVVVVVGAVLFLFPFLSTNVNPDVTLGFFGLLVIVLGGLTLAANSFGRRLRPRGLGFILSVAGWSTFASGTLISLAGFLLGSQVMCSCPASGACACFVPLYSIMLYGGFIAALGGAAGIGAGAIASRKRPTAPAGVLATNPAPNTRLGRKTVTVLAIAVTVVVIFALFSYWPGVYVTSINERTQFLGGIPPIVDLQNPHAPPFMTSPTSQPASGFQLPIGGSFSYVLHFNSVPSYPNYEIEALSLTSGFSIASLNASLPLVVSPADPSISLAFSVKGPYYPYYGDVSFFMTIKNLNQSGA